MSDQVLNVFSAVVLTSTAVQNLDTPIGAKGVPTATNFLRRFMRYFLEGVKPNDLSSRSLLAFLPNSESVV